MKKLLITGVSGLLGSNVAYCLRDQFKILGIYHEHPVSIDGINTLGINLLNECSVVNIITAFKPDIVLHCASLTNVDFCEVNQDLAREVNVGGTRVIASAMKCLPHAKLVYVSSDLVYGGKQLNSCEVDAAAPINFYGMTKLEGEQEALKRENVLVLRTNIFGWNIQNKQSLSEWVIHQLTQGHKVLGFKDVFFSSIYTFDFARLLLRALNKDIKGIYNLGSSGSLSKYEFSIELAQLFGLDKSLIRAISVDQSELKAKRAKNISLNIDKLTKDISLSPPTLLESIGNFHKDFIQDVSKDIKEGKRTGPNYPKNSEIPYGRQTLDDQDIESVVNVLKYSHLTQGVKVAEFEEALCRNTGAKYAVAVNSGTSALHIACLAAGVKYGDEVLTSSNTFVASANCVFYCGGKPIICDIDPVTYNISLQEIERNMSDRCRVVIPVHFAGQSCLMADIREIVGNKEKILNRKSYIIEDASHALGSYYRGIPVGACTYSDMTVMSFHPVKHITTGEGGAVLTNDEELYRKLKLLRSHGITNDANWLVNHEMAYSPSKAKEGLTNIQNPWYYEQIDLGYNYRITDIQCALGLSQLGRLERFRSRRRQIISKYNKIFANLEGIKTPFEHEDSNANFHLYVLNIDFEKFGISRAQLMRNLREAGIVTQVHYIPVHLQPYYTQKIGTKKGDCPNAEKYYEQCLSIPLFGSMTDEMVEKVTKELLWHLNH